MADFRLTIESGVTVQSWEDPASVSLPSRLNPQPDHEHRRYVGVVGTPVQIVASVPDLGEGPADEFLSGELFECSMVEFPGVVPPSFTEPTPGTSSVQAFTPNAVGHYTFLMIRRGAHGGIYGHVDVDS